VFLSRFVDGIVMAQTLARWYAIPPITPHFKPYNLHSLCWSFITNWNIAKWMCDDETTKCLPYGKNW